MRRVSDVIPSKSGLAPMMADRTGSRDDASHSTGGRRKVLLETAAGCVAARHARCALTCRHDAPECISEGIRMSDLCTRPSSGSWAADSWHRLSGAGGGAAASCQEPHGAFFVENACNHRECKVLGWYVRRPQRSKSTVRWTSEEGSVREFHRFHGWCTTLQGVARGEEALKGGVSVQRRTACRAGSSSTGLRGLCRAARVHPALRHYRRRSGLGDATPTG